MTIPLGVLALLAIFGGLLNLPFGQLDFLHQWLEGVPFIDVTEEVLHTSTGVEAILVTCSILAALAGIFLGWLVYQKHRLKAVEPEILLHGWYIDEGVAWTVANPGLQSWEDVQWVDTNIIDGAVMGSGALLARSAGVFAATRPATSGSTPSASGSVLCSCSAGSSWPGCCRRWTSRSSPCSSCCRSSVPAATLLVPEDRPELARLVGPLFSIATGVLAIWLLCAYDTDSPDTIQFATNHVWIEQLGISWHLGADGISLLMVTLTGIMLPLSLIGIDPEHKDKSYFAWFLFLEAAVMGAFLSLDMFLFFVCFEVSLVPLYFLIAGWGHGDNVRSATKFFLFTSLASVFMLVAMVSTAVIFKQESGGPLTFDVVTIAQENTFSATTGRWLFAGFAIAFAVKAALFPVHTWLPDAHGNAPTAGSVDLAAIMLKLGTYGFLRFGLYLFPEASVWAGPLLRHDRGDRHPVGCDLRGDAEGPQARASRTRRSPTSGSSSWAPSRSRRRASRAASCRCSTTACRAARSSCSSATSTSGATRSRSAP